MKHEIITVKSIEQLKALYDCSAMTWEGLAKESFNEALDKCGVEGSKGYLIKGEIMNKICHLSGNNAYPNDLNIFSIDKFKGLAMLVGARWLDDIIDNNAHREGFNPFES